MYVLLDYFESKIPGGDNGSSQDSHRNYFASKINNASPLPESFFFSVTTNV